MNSPADSKEFHDNIAQANAALGAVKSDYLVLRGAMNEAALKAAAKAICVRHCHQENTETKKDGSFLTEGDKAAQLIIVGRLEEFAQKNGIFLLRYLAEEQDEIPKIAKAIYPNDPAKEADLKKRMLTPQQWVHDKAGLIAVIDPIDGTFNYANRPDHSCAVSIALQHDGHSIASAIYVIEPNSSKQCFDAGGNFTGLKGKLYWAEKNKGAYAVDFAQAPQPAARLLNDPKLKQQNGLPVLGNFFSDSAVAGRKYNDAGTGPQFERLLKAVNPQAELSDVEPMMSAVVAGLKVVDPSLNDGTKNGSAAYAHEYHMPWDQAGIELFFQEANIPHQVCDADPRAYGLKMEEEKPITSIIAARNHATFKEMQAAYKTPQVELNKTARREQGKPLSQSFALGA